MTMLNPIYTPTKTVIFLLLVLATLDCVTSITYAVPSRKNRTDMCPPQLQGSLWGYRAEDFCGRGSNSSLYHCLQEQVSGYIELCIQPQIVPKGQYILWSDIGKRLYTRNCWEGFYQETDMYSNEFYECPKRKSNCDEPGMLTDGCDDGGTTQDRSCRCDYENGYVADTYAFNNPFDKSCFLPHLTLGGCTHIPCGNNTILNAAYRCVNCPEGSYLPDMSTKCLPTTFSPSTFSTKEVDKTTSSTPSVTSSVEEISIERIEKSERSILILLVAVSIIIGLLFVGGSTYGISRCYKHFWMPKAKGEDHRKEIDEVISVEQDEELSSLNMHLSVGQIHYKGNNLGTGFLIDKDRIMTAFHVIDKVLNSIWENIVYDYVKSADLGDGSDISNTIRKAVKSKSDNWQECMEKISISALCSHLMDHGEETKAEQIKEEFGQEYIRDSFYIIFDRGNGGEEIKCYLSYDIIFASHDKDIAILRIDGRRKYPDLKPLRMAVSPATLNKCFTIFGYPTEDNKLQADPNCRRLRNIKSSTKESKKHFKAWFKEHKKFEVKSSEIKKDYNLETSNHKFYFNCSVSMSHGASGSPCVVPMRFESGVFPVVIGVLTKGHPAFFYRKSLYEEMKSYPEHRKHTIEEGVSVMEVKKLLNDNRKSDSLYNLFKDSESKDSLRCLYQDLPVVTMQRDTYEVRLGDPVTLTCTVTGYFAQKTLKWEMALSEDETTYHPVKPEVTIVTVCLGEGKHHSSLTIEKITDTDYGHYRCTVLLHKYENSGRTKVIKPEDPPESSMELQELRVDAHLIP